MACSAPSFRHASHFSGVPAVAIGRAFQARLSMIAMLPMPLAPPWIKTVSPARKPARVTRLSKTVNRFSGKLAAPLAGMAVGHLIAYAFDYPRHIKSGDIGCPWGRRILALALHDIGARDACRFHANEHFAWIWPWYLPFCRFQNLGAAKRGDLDYRHFVHASIFALAKQIF